VFRQARVWTLRCPGASKRLRRVPVRGRETR
jgi:hypothetical protein